MKHSEQANKYHQYDGYNCCQAVLAAYDDVLNIDASVLFKLSEGFGIGSGAMNGLCGAVNAGIMILSYLISSGDLSGNTNTKGKTYRIIRDYQDRFQKQTKALICRQLKDPKSETYTPCANCISIACDCLDEILTELPL